MKLTKDRKVNKEQTKSATRSRIGKILVKTAMILVWIIIWQVASVGVDNDLLFPGTLSVLKSLEKLLMGKEFYLIIRNSFIRITAGFLLAFAAGILVAALSSICRGVEEFLSPLIYCAKALPVASFIILLLILVGSENVAAIISFIVVFPMIYIGTLEGIRQIDKRLLEMAQVFHMGWARKLRYIYAPQVFPYIVANCRVAFGMCWKAGVSAEVIGIPKKSIGEQMYLSKLYLQTAELLAWSIAIVIISAVFEQLFIKVLELIKRRLER